jgi:hypothetical protein
MKIKRKNRIINNNNNNNTKNIIFVSSNCKINNKKLLNLNKTKLFYKTEASYIISSKFKKINLESLSKEFNIKKQNILEIINIYKNNLFIIILDWNTEMPHFNIIQYLDLFKPQTLSIYNDIYNYNIKTDYTYLNEYLINNNYKLKLIDIYYYLIGYI